MSVVSLLMDLTELGLGDQQVPGPAGRTWNARELAAHARAEALALRRVSTSQPRRTSVSGTRADGQQPL
ncbi:hypothetical protein [Streptomyces sp. F001]|uniref:hypothetical protein n=1 Tax=Streptomyces sp. F001 TaxID=1510026 RepID=UPI0019D00FC4|nr:hypothetical protein [Streptomyces sp. F001]